MVKTITITDDAYSLLKKRKGPSSSFSKTIQDIFKDEKGNNLDKHFGILKSKGRNAEEMQRELKDKKKSAEKALGEKDKRLKTRLYDSS